ncbi:MAG: M48 family metallopeptidase [Candidatus Delongbacteria bacterium]|nr:M48 family metallopeptidase [Candidatus Delongbacteria bacterium]
MITTIFCAVLFGKYLLEVYLEFLNNKHRSSNLPDEIKNRIDISNYKKATHYDKINHKILTVNSTIYLALLLCVIIFNGFAILDNLVSLITSNTITKSLLFFGFILLTVEIINIPIDIYKTFVVEEKFGFNKTTPKLFLLDKLKALLFKVIFGTLVLSTILWFYKSSPKLFWIYTWILTSVIMTIVIMFYSNIFVPIFNTQKPLEEGDLKTSILNFFKSIGLKIDNVYVLNASKRSTKVNAYFAGLGNKKRIVIYDTLIQDFTKDEIVAIVAHEAGHYKHRHLGKDIIINILINGLLFFLFSKSLNFPEISTALGVDSPNIHIGFVGFIILYTPISFILNILTRRLSRKHEFEADEFAKKNSMSEDMISALIKINTKNLKNLLPHPSYVNIYYTHPTLLQRIDALRS